MRIEVVKYDVEWPKTFEKIKKEINIILSSQNLIIEHIGSTSIPNLKAKPIIDIAVGIDNIKRLNETIEPLISNNFIYIEKYNDVMPDRRFFIGLKNKYEVKNFKSTYTKDDIIPFEKMHQIKLCHIHIWEYKSKDWLRHIVFRDYLRNNKQIREKYEQLKTQLSLQNWVNSNEYNNSKNEFIKIEEKNAIEWFCKKTTNISQTQLPPQRDAN